MNELKEEIFETAVQDFREKIISVEGRINEIIEDNNELSVHCPLKHSFGDGLYVREMFAMAGSFIISKIHKYDHPYFLLAGTLDILTEDGVVRVKAPYYGITKAGTKRAAFIWEDTIWVTVHATDKKDVDEIVDDVTAKDFNALDEFLNKDALVIENKEA